jgi:hypothetical protein
MPAPSRSRKKAVLLLAVPFWISACLLSGRTPAGTPVVGTTAASGRVESEARETTESPATPSETPLIETATLTPTSTIVHLMTPPGAGGTTRYITDFDTKPYAPQKKAIGGDEYHNNRWERPFTAEAMEYLPDVDLKRVDLKIQSPWVYVTFEFLDPRAEGIGQTMYGAEFDLNKDDRGDYLIWGVSPPSGEWTTDGVEVWKDTNYDVGGPTPQASNAPWELGDGYDENLFSGGSGADPDLAWIRQIEGGKEVQLAFKYSVLNNASQFLWNGLADLGVRNPAWMDYNDHFTQKEAGSPLPVQTTLYPLKELWGLDNTCRDAYGFTPTGTEAGLCLYTGSISGMVFLDNNENGIPDAGEPPYPHGVVQLGQGACPSSGYGSMSINGSGQYAFQNIPTGTYCVRYSEPAPPSGDFVVLSPNPVTVTLVPNEAETVNFVVFWTEPVR